MRRAVQRRTSNNYNSKNTIQYHSSRMGWVKSATFYTQLHSLHTLHCTTQTVQKCFEFFKANIARLCALCMGKIHQQWGGCCVVVIAASCMCVLHIDWWTGHKKAKSVVGVQSTISGYVVRICYKWHGDGMGWGWWIYWQCSVTTSFGRVLLAN